MSDWLYNKWINKHFFLGYPAKKLPYVISWDAGSLAAAHSNSTGSKHNRNLLSHNSLLTSFPWNCSTTRQLSPPLHSLLAIRNWFRPTRSVWGCWLDKSAVQWAGRVLTAGAEAWPPLLRILPCLLPHHVPRTVDPCALASPRPGSILSRRSRRWWRGRPPVPAPERRSNGERRPPVPRPPCGDLQVPARRPRRPRAFRPSPALGCAPAWPPSRPRASSPEPGRSLSPGWALGQGLHLAPRVALPAPPRRPRCRPWPRRFGIARLSRS